MKRRSFLAGMLASGVAPIVITKPGVLMPVRQIAELKPPEGMVKTQSGIWYTPDATHLNKEGYNRFAEIWMRHHFPPGPYYPHA